MKSTAQTIKNIALGTIPFLLILIIWYVFCYFNLVPGWLIPSPFQTAKAFLGLAIDGTLVHLVIISAENAVPAFIFGLVFALIMGILIGMSATAKKIFYPFLSAIYPIPSLVWLPLIILFLGFTRQTVWCVVFISCFRIIIYNVVEGVSSVSQNWILAAKNLGLSKLEIIFKVILPGSLPHILTGVRMGFASSWRSLIAAEMLVVTIGGLGKFIWMAQWAFSFEKVFAGIIVISLIGLLMERFVFGKLEKITLIRWGFIREETQLR